MPLLDDTWIPEGSRIIVACSGGGDSVALLHLLAAEAAGRKWDLTVAHLDHALRPASSDDARFTTRLAEELGLKCVTERREITAEKKSGENTESAARRVRYDFLGEVRDAEAPGGLIATGHTLDDQLETIALRLERGAGLRGQRGILPRREDDVIRPLLGTRRDHLRQWLTVNSMTFCSRKRGDWPIAPECSTARSTSSRGGGPAGPGPLICPGRSCSRAPRGARHRLRSTR